MIVAGIDPGSRRTGFGIIAVEGNRVRCLEYGAINAIRKRSDTFPRRLQRIYNQLKTCLNCYSPQAVAVEGVFHAVNARTALQLGQARGVALLAAVECGAELFEYSPLQVKKAVVGYGRAEKSQVQLMVRRILNLKSVPEPHDAADALAIALCHAFNRTPTPATIPSR